MRWRRVRYRAPTALGGEDVLVPDLEGLDVVEFAEVIALGRLLEAVEGCAV